MKQTVGRWLVGAALACAAAVGPTSVCRAADQPAAPSAEWPLTEAAALPASSDPGARPPAYVLPTPGWPTVEFVQPDPLLERPYTAQPGWYTDAQADVLFVHLRNQLGGPVPNKITGNNDFVSLPGPQMDPTVSPTFEVGYRLPDGWGSLQLGYRFLATSGRDQLASGPADVVQADANLFGRIDYNLADLTYVSREFSLDPNWNMRWGVGARTAVLYFDSRGSFLDPGSGPGAVLAQTESDHIVYYAVWAFMDLERHIFTPGLCAFARLEGTDGYARNSQNYTETVAGNAGEIPISSQNRFDGASGVSILRGEIGLSYTVPEWNYSRFVIGGVYESWFQIGRQSPTSGVIDTRGELDVYGLFVRAEFNF
jgi:hypothetical protein